MLVYFGYPQAHEDDAARAVYAGLEIVAGLGELNRNIKATHSTELAMRIGIHTGLVVAGDMRGAQSGEADAVIGETPNIAARLQELAVPNSVVISENTRRLAEGLFVFEDLGPQPIKGITRDIHGFRVADVSGASSRFAAAAERGLTRLVGRNEEINLLTKRWESARDGEGQAVWLSGEAGVGKSRIVAAFRERLPASHHELVYYSCSPYYANSPLYPAIDQLERAFGFEKSDSTAARWDKLQHALSAMALTDDETAPLLAALLSLPAAGLYRPVQANPQLLWHKTLEAQIAVIARVAQRAPLLVVLEDAHWIDPSTSELLNHLVERLPAMRIFLLVTSRPEFSPTWIDHTRLTALRLNRLSRVDSAALATRTAGDKTLPAEVLEQILQRTDGVPRFLEELTKTVLESGLLIEEGDAWRLEGPLPPLAIPSSLHDSLIARLDRLAAVKEVAQLAAMLGRTFSHDLLGAVSPLSEAALADALDQLEAAQLVHRRSLAPEITYEFKHALVQEAAYLSLLRSARQSQHARIAAIIAERFPEIAENEPETIAHHYTEAGLPAAAIEYWRAAGQRAMRRSAHIEAEGHLRKGIELLAEIEGDERQRLEILLLNTLGVCIMPTRGFSDPEVADTFERAAELSELAGDDRALFVALRGHGQFKMIAGDIKAASAQTERILAVADELHDRDFAIEAHHLGWSALCMGGDFAAARTHAEAGIALYERERDHQLAYVYSGHDPGMCCRSYGSLAWWQLGYPDQALAISKEGMVLAETLDHPFTSAIALWATGVMYQLRRETKDVGKIGDTLVDHCARHGFGFLMQIGKILRGGSLAASGGRDEASDGILEFREGLVGLQNFGMEFGVPSFYAFLAVLCARAGDLASSREAIEDGLSMSTRNGDTFCLPELHRITGFLNLIQNPENISAAEKNFTTAVEIARAQQAKMLELRAATNLAILWRECGRSGEARELLAPIYGWFTEGFDTVDLVEAKAVLEGLR